MLACDVSRLSQRLLLILGWPVVHVFQMTNGFSGTQLWSGSPIVVLFRIHKHLLLMTFSGLDANEPRLYGVSAAAGAMPWKRWCLMRFYMPGMCLAPFTCCGFRMSSTHCLSFCIWWSGIWYTELPSRVVWIITSRQYRHWFTPLTEIVCGWSVGSGSSQVSIALTGTPVFPMNICRWWHISCLN